MDKEEFTIIASTCPWRYETMSNAVVSHCKALHGTSFPNNSRCEMRHCAPYYMWLMMRTSRG